MEEPPQQDCRSHKQQSKNLISSVNARLFRPPRLLSYLFQVRLNASLHYGLAPGERA